MGTENGLVIQPAPLEWDYTPEFAGNRDLASPCVAHLKQPTVAEFDKAIAIGRVGDVDRAAIVRAGLVSIDGLKLGIKRIKDYDGLMAAGVNLFGLYSELFGEILRPCRLVNEDAEEGEEYEKN